MYEAGGSVTNVTLTSGAYVETCKAAVFCRNEVLQWAHKFDLILSGLPMWGQYQVKRITSISNQSSQSTVTSRLQLQQSGQVVSRLQKKMGRKTAKRRIVRYSLLSINLLLLAGVVWFVLRNPQASVAVTKSSVASAQDNTMATSPLDQLSSSDIAVTVARMTNLPETTAVTNQAQTQTAEQAIIQSSANLVSKPQVVATAFKSNKDIKIYYAKKHDSVSKIASAFNVTSDSIRWSNSLDGGDVSPGQKLYIPPVNGIVYIVKHGDTPASLAQAYHANKQQIIAYNDAELSGLYKGELIIIPNGAVLPAADASYSSGSYSTGFAWGGATPIYNGNGYDYGFCTWYVATQIKVPSNWGNASSWAYYAGLSGWNVSSTPTVGAIAQTPYAAGGEGHVAIVTAVKGNQIQYKDMNGIAGWGAVGYSGWVSAGQYPNYITP